MGRSIETIGENVAYFDASFCEDSYDFNEIAAGVVDALQKRYPSLVAVKNKWVLYPYTENRVVLENDHVQISVSEYCGRGAFSVFVRPGLGEYWPFTTNLADAWLDQCWNGIRRTILGCVVGLRHVATFSNGEAVFEKELDTA